LVLALGGAFALQSSIQTKNTAKDNGFLAFLTFGEGYHNYHHLFESDYRNSIRWWQFDPTKWLIKPANGLD
jgi:stearoyl-CoA desaturase (delta-9 desaturase)